MTKKRTNQDHLNQALHELYLSYERGRAEYCPIQNGWKSLHAFKELVLLNEAHSVRPSPNATFRISLLGVAVARRVQEENQ